MTRCGLSVVLLSLILLLGSAVNVSGGRTASPAACPWAFSTVSEYEWGTVRLCCGLGHLFYWKSGAEGKNGGLMGDGKFQARKYMGEHDGDWCVVMIELKDGRRLQLGIDGYVELTLEDGSVARSDRVLITESPLDTRFWNLETGYMLFENGKCEYIRTAKSGWYPLYVRFPEQSCLGEDVSAQQREFRSNPVRVALVGAKEVK